MKSSLSHHRLTISTKNILTSRTSPRFHARDWLAIIPTKDPTFFIGQDRPRQLTLPTNFTVYKPLHGAQTSVSSADFYYHQPSSLAAPISTTIIS